MQPHTGAAVSVVCFLLPDIVEQYLKGKKDPDYPAYIFPARQFSVKSSVPTSLHRDSSKTYNVELQTPVFDLRDFRLAIGQTYHCYVQIRVGSISSSELKIQLFHNHTPCPSEGFTISGNMIRGYYESFVNRYSFHRNAYKITVDQDVMVRHSLIGDILSTREYEFDKDSPKKRAQIVRLYDHPTKSTNPARKFEFEYRYELESYT